MAEKFGGIEGRKRGGRVSQIRRKQNPKHYIDLGCNVAKESLNPKKSMYLSEIVGAILGDGGLTSNQLHITLNSEKDADYCVYLRNLLKRIFMLEVCIFKRKNVKAVVLTISGVNFVKNLMALGLKVGNKVKQQVGVPEWITNNPDYSKACLRGLMDTDGGVFLDKYVVNGKEYSYLKICFTNKSRPLIDFAYDTLLFFGYNPKLYSDNKVWLYSYREVERYLKEIGSSNNRLNKWIKC